MLKGIGRANQIIRDAKQELQDLNKKSIIPSGAQSKKRLSMDRVSIRHLYNAGTRVNNISEINDYEDNA